MREKIKNSIEQMGLLTQFMTRLPFPWKIEYDNEKLGKSMRYFPVVGLVIGVLNLITGLILENIFKTSGMITAILLVAQDVILTGGLHLDGLADTFDGIFSYRSKQKMLEIMKDSRVGTNGVLILIFYILAKVIFLNEAATSLQISQGVIMLIAAIVSRVNSVINCGIEEYARPVGMGKAFVENTTKKDVTFSIVIASIFLIIISKYSNESIVTILAISVITYLTGYLFGKLMTRKIGGITGDTLGALLELSSLLVIVLIYFLR